MGAGWRGLKEEREKRSRSRSGIFGMILYLLHSVNEGSEEMALIIRAFPELFSFPAQSNSGKEEKSASFSSLLRTSKEGETSSLPLTFYLNLADALGEEKLGGKKGGEGGEINVPRMIKLTYLLGGEGTEEKEKKGRR